MKLEAKNKTILFVCTCNAGRSQIALALFERLAGSEVAVLSAGVAPWPDLHPVARSLLQERGFDVSSLHPKHVNSFVDTPLDVVVTIGDRARKAKLRSSRQAPCEYTGTSQIQPTPTARAPKMPYSEELSNR